MNKPLIIVWNTWSQNKSFPVIASFLGPWGPGQLGHSICRTIVQQCTNLVPPQAEVIRPNGRRSPLQIVFPLIFRRYYFDCDDPIPLKHIVVEIPGKKKAHRGHMAKRGRIRGFWPGNLLGKGYLHFLNSHFHFFTLFFTGETVTKWQKMAYPAKIPILGPPIWGEVWGP